MNEPEYTPDNPKYDIEVELLDQSANAFSIIARVDAPA